ncbi:hypothetical protein D3C81_1500570 [compost metagenome]
MSARVESEGQSRQMAELRFIVFLAGVGLLMKPIAQAQIGKGLLHVLQRLIAEFMIHADHELSLEPATGVEVTVELVDLLHRLVDAVDQSHQFHVGRQDVAVALQLLADKVHRALPERAAWRIQQHHRHQWTFTGLDQCQHFQRFIQRAEATGA